jgi:antitoxin HigA-1
MGSPTRVPIAKRLAAIMNGTTSMIERADVIIVSSLEAGACGNWVSKILKSDVMTPAIHPGRLLRREMAARDLSANRLAILLGVPSGRITDILNRRRSISADTALRLGRYFGNSPQFWIDLQGQYDIALAEQQSGEEIRKHVHPADAA